MYHFSLPSSFDPPTGTPFYLVLSDWLEAVSAFRESYYQLNHALVSYKTGGEPSSRFIGQYAISHVSDLLATMYHELEVLLAELERPSNLSILMNHTTRLRLLTNRATVITGLVIQSSC